MFIVLKRIVVYIAKKSKLWEVEDDWKKHDEQKYKEIKRKIESWLNFEMNAGTTTNEWKNPNLSMHLTENARTDSE